jgi:hypothetical protein
MHVFFTAVEQFDSSHGEAWRKYIEWSGLHHLKEIVSLDPILCPSLFCQLIDEDWKHNVCEDYKTSLFHDLDYVMSRVGGRDRTNILAVMQNPSEAESRTFTDSRFDFRGYDLIEAEGGTGVSALVNCGGFDQSFLATDLSECGLLPDYSKALAVQQSLLTKYPEEPHADCDIWAIWQRKELA